MTAEIHHAAAGPVAGPVAGTGPSPARERPASPDFVQSLARCLAVITAFDAARALSAELSTVNR